jgi:hypothetical protein
MCTTVRASHKLGPGCEIQAPNKEAVCAREVKRYDV